MCIVPAMIGKAVGGRTGGIIGAGLGGGLPAALVASKLFKKPKQAVASSTGTGAVNPYGG